MCKSSIIGARKSKGGRAWRGKKNAYPFLWGMGARHGGDRKLARSGRLIDGGPCTYPLDSNQIDERGVPITVKSTPAWKDVSAWLVSGVAFRSFFHQQAPTSPGPGENATEQQKNRREETRISEPTIRGMAALPPAVAEARENRQRQRSRSCGGRTEARFIACRGRGSLGAGSGEGSGEESGKAERE